MKKLYLTSLIFSSLYGCGEAEPLIDIETYDRINKTFGVSYAEVKVTATTDKIEILDIIVNRGNCKNEDISKAMGFGETFPQNLSFGQSVSMSFSGPCNAKQVDIITNLGDWTWTY